MTVYIGNSFSLQMLQLQKHESATLRVEAIELAEVAEYLADDSFVSCVGHPDTAAIYSDLLTKFFDNLSFVIEPNRVEVTLCEGDILLIGQIKGRLPVGTTELPPDVTITWLRVGILY